MLKNFKNGFTCLLIALLASLGASASAQHLRYFEPGDETSGAKIRNHVGYFGDRSGESSLPQLLQNPGLFIPLGEKPVFRSFKMHWYRLPLANSSDRDDTWVISTGIASATVLNAFWVDAQGVHPIARQEPISRFALQSHLRIPIDLPANSRGTVYIQYAGVAQFPLDIELYTPAEYLHNRFKYTLLNGFTLGVVTVFLVFFTLQFYLHRRSYLAFYCLFIFSIEIFAVQVFGYGVRFFMPERVWLDTQATHLAAGMIYIFYFLFSAHLFPRSQKLNRLLKILALVTTATTVIGFFTELNFVLTLIVALGMPLGIIAAVRSARENPLTARFYIAGSMMHYVLAGLLLLMLLGLPLGRTVFGLATAGQLLDILCFSIAIMLSHRRTEQLLNSQVAERLHDLQSLNAAEQVAQEMRQLNKSTVLDATSTAHDLQQVLSSIRLQLELADQGKANPMLQQTLSYAADLLKQKLRQGQDSYQSLARIEPLHQILEDAWQRHHLRYPQLRVKAQQANLPCSRLAINRILDNLLVNACRYGGGRGVLLSGRRAKGGYLIQVRDRGEGITEDKLQRILEPFRQVNKEDMNDLGVGLGLHIVKFICEQFDFRFEIKSWVARGTRVSIWLETRN